MQRRRAAAATGRRWRAEFEFGAERFHYRPWAAFAVGMAIAMLSSALGVGGGFLLVPFMALLLHLPMFVVAGTAALAIFMSSAASISSYVALGVRLDLPLLDAAARRDLSPAPGSDRACRAISASAGCGSC
jgi:uncharacterized membrane protein YfcA